MNLQKELKHTIKRACFELLSEDNNRPAEEVILSFIKRVEALSGLTYLGIYAYSDWEKKYKLLAKSHVVGATYGKLIKKMNQLVPYFDTYEFNKGILNGKLIVEHHPEHVSSRIIQVQPYKEKIYYIMIMSDHSSSPTDELLGMLKRDISQYLYIVERFFVENRLNEQRAFLLDVTSKLKTTMNDSDVLKLLSDSLVDHYPDFEHYFLVSYDYNIDYSLPIKLMEYSDCVTQQISTQAFTTGEIQFERDPDADFAYIYAPLTGSQGVYGVIQIIIPIKQYFPTEDVAFLKEFAQIAGRAMESTMLDQNASLMIADLKLINKAIHELNSNLKLVELISIIKTKIDTICAPTEIGFVFVDEEDMMEYNILDGSTSFFRTQKGELFTKTLASKMTEHIEPIFSGDYTTVCAQAVHKSTMAIPMIHANRYFGFIVIVHDQAAWFSFDNFKLIQSLVHHSTLVFSNTLLKNKLEILAITDYLTKLHSRRYLDEKLKEHMKSDSEGTLILLDVDDFKEINDTFGHSVGDEVLVQLGAIIKDTIEVTDIAARWGGEEFAIFLPNKNLAAGIKLAETLKVAVSKRTQPRVSFSCGVTTWHASQTNSIKSILKRADKALYRAKDSGKNCMKIKMGTR